MNRPQKPQRPPAGRGPRPGLQLWGIHPVLAALANPQRHCHRLMATAETARAHAAELERLAKARRLPALETVARNDLDQWLPDGAVHQGIAVSADPLPAMDIADLVDLVEGRDTAVIMVLDQIGRASLGKECQ